MSIVKRLRKSETKPNPGCFLLISQEILPSPSQINNHQFCLRDVRRSDTPRLDSKHSDTV